jgi:hypothetical protein
MKQKHIENALGRALARSTPDLLDTLLRTEVVRDEAPETYRPQRKPAKPFRAYRPALVFTSLLLVLLMGIGSYLTPSTLVALDINPSLEITANPYGRVIRVSALDGKTMDIVGALPLKNKDLDDAVRSIIEALLASGYLQETDNAILVSVSGKSREGSSGLQERIVAGIKQTLSAHEAQAVVYDQAMAPPKSIEETKEQARTNQISTGKMLLIEKLSAQDPELDSRTLAGLPMKDIVHLAKDRKINLHQLLNFDEESNNPDAHETGEKPVGPKEGSGTSGGDRQSTGKNSTKGSGNG